MNKVLVTGSKGQLGSEIREVASNYTDAIFFNTDSASLDITDRKALREYINHKKINIIINCAAYTAVDKAELEPKLANIVNHLAVENIARIAKESDIKLVHISTDYVFDGTNHKPYVETDKPNPLSVYGTTKLAGELAMEKINPANSIIIRTSWLYSQFGSNFVKTILKLSKNQKVINVVSDQIGTPTNAYDLALAIIKILPLIKNQKVETFHYSNEGVCSWYDLACAISELKKISVKINPIVSSDLSSRAERPFYSLMSKNKIRKKMGIVVPNWYKSLESYLNL